MYHRYYDVKEYGTWIRIFVHAEISEAFELPEGALAETNKRTQEVDVCGKNIEECVENSNGGAE